MLSTLLPEKSNLYTITYFNFKDYNKNPLNSEQDVGKLSWFLCIKTGFSKESVSSTEKKCLKTISNILRLQT